MNTTTTTTESPMTVVKERIEQAFQKAEQVYGRKFERCQVAMDFKANCGKGGTAQVTPVRKIRINQYLYRQNKQHIVDVTCPHEVAHIVAFDLYGREGWNHGLLWKGVMRNIGLPPKRCHSLITPAAMRHPVYHCQSCGHQSRVRQKDHFGIKMGKLVLKPCAKCRGKQIYAGTVRELMLKKTLTCLEMPDNLS